MSINLYDYQIDAINHMKNGCILCGNVGSGKSLTSLSYYYLENGGDPSTLCGGDYVPMSDPPRDLYIITTARKRDILEWDRELIPFLLSKNPEVNIYGNHVVIDSWNNIKKYKDVYGAFFIFDEQRVVGNGTWVKTFLNITRKNRWILLSATPGDQWSDYIPVFVANGFYKNKTEFAARHCVYSRFAKYPKIERYIDERTLKAYRDDILVPMEDNRRTKRNVVDVYAKYDKLLYRTVYRDHWNPYDEEPIAESGKYVYLLRRVVNSDVSRIDILNDILAEKKKAIVFYNFTYELEMLREYCENVGVEYAEWNGLKHENIPECESWLYLVQYSAGCEGWNCITTDTIIFYSQNYSYRITEQASGRIDRINTPYKNLYYYHIRSRAPIDLMIHKALKNKKNFNESSIKFRRN